MKVVLDIETTAFDPEHYDKPSTVEKIHCVVCMDAESGEVTVFDDGVFGRPFSELKPLLDSADEIIGHNILCFDQPVIERILGFKIDSSKVTDTLVLSHLGYTNLELMDYRIAIPRGHLPKQYCGQHSLRAWGYRIGKLKLDINEQWDKYTEKMLTYCKMDVEITKELYWLFMKWAVHQPMAVTIEHKYAYIINRIMTKGVLIDKDKAVELLEMFQEKMKIIENEAPTVFPDRAVPPISEVGELPKDPYWNPKQLVKKPKVYPLNIGSAQQMIWFLNKKYGWVPTELTEKNNFKFDQEIIESLPFAEAKIIADYKILAARIATLVGDSGYLTLLKSDGRLHGKIEHCGAVTHRCTHSAPNTANPTSPRSKYGKEIRSIFCAPPGYKMVGFDAQGLELRLLAEALYPLDDGEFAKTVLLGKKEDGTDAHSINQKRAGVATRDDAKTVIYALIYGAGNEKMGYIKRPEGEFWDKDTLKVQGKKLKDTFLANWPALRKLMSRHKTAWKEFKYMLGLDGRRAEILSAHQSLNTELQMNGAIVMKYVTVFLYESLIELGWEFGNHWSFVLSVHDELQSEVREDLVEIFSEKVHEAFRKTTKTLRLKVPMEGEVNVGNNWTETH